MESKSTLEASPRRLYKQSMANQSCGPCWGLVLVRLAAGYTLLVAGWGKVSGDAIPPIVSWANFDSAFFTWWGEHLIQAFPKTFSFMIAWGEFLGGAALLLGALTRPAGILSAFMLLCFWFAGPESAQDKILLLGTMCLACGLSAAGARAGLDAILRQHFPRWLTWMDARE
jgi:uncharacterized membrane protein YphA (DoxX/SURF4 family)